MRCKACDDLLQEHDLIRRGFYTNEFLDLCTSCFDTIKDDIVVVEPLAPDEFLDDNIDHG